MNMHWWSSILLTGCDDVYRTCFTPPCPARSAFGANGLALGGLLEVECIAVAGAKS